MVSSQNQDRKTRVEGRNNNGEGETECMMQGGSRGMRRMMKRKRGFGGWGGGKEVKNISCDLKWPIRIFIWSPE